MRHILATLLIVGAMSPALGQDTDGTGRFPVFGPSAEREAFFAEQKEAEDERAEALRREAHERAVAEANRPVVVENRRVVTSPVLPVNTVRRCRELPRPTSVVDRKRGPRSVPVAPNAAADPRPVIRCRTVVLPYGVPPYPYPRDRIRIRVDEDGVSGRARIVRPGVDLRVHVD